MATDFHLFGLLISIFNTSLHAFHCPTYRKQGRNVYYIYFSPHFQVKTNNKSCTNWLHWPQLLKALRPYRQSAAPTNTILMASYKLGHTEQPN
jgi:hypothetical protein